MSNEWLIAKETNDSRIFAAVNGDEILAERIRVALETNKVERVLSKVDRDGSIKTFRLDTNGNRIGEWP